MNWKPYLQKMALFLKVRKIEGLRSGLTLVEVLVSVALISLIMIGIYETLIIGNKSWNQDMGMLDLQQDARLAMDGMVREIRQGNSSDVSITDNGAVVEFSLPDAGATENIRYYLNNDNQLIREHPEGTEKILADDVNSVNFLLNADVLSLQIDMAKTVQGQDLSFSLKEKVRFRNE